MKMFSLLLVLISVSCSSRENQEQVSQVISVEDRARAIRESFTLLSQSSQADLAANEALLFEAFPGSFQEFLALYGEGKTFYESGYDHLMTLYNMKTIPSEKIVKKYIDLSKNGVWEADNTRELQWQAMDKILRNVEVANKYLAGKSEADIRSVFHFLLDSPHPQDKARKEAFETMVAKFAPINTVFAEYIKSEYADVVKERTH